MLVIRGISSTAILGGSMRMVTSWNMMMLTRKPMRQRQRRTHIAASN